MPIYEYQCAQCGHQMEVLVRAASDIPGRCPKCRAPKLRKLFSSFAVAAPDPTAHCQTCPTSADACSGGTCRAGACPYSSE